MDRIKKKSRGKAYRTPAQKINIRNLILLAFLVMGVCGAYLLFRSYPEKP